MSKSTDDAGSIQALLERMEKWRLPRALAIKTRVDAGEKLTENDMQFLKQVFADANSAQALVQRNPEYQKLAAELVSLYDAITRKGLENEQMK